MLDQRADFEDSKRIAAEHNGRLVTLKEFIFALKEDPSLLRKAKNNGFWLGGEPGLEVNGYCRINYEEGILVQVSQWEWGKLSPQDRAYAYRGSGPIALGGYYDSRYWGRQLDVYATDTPEFIAPRVAFVPLGKYEQEPSSADDIQALLRESEHPLDAASYL